METKQAKILNLYRSGLKMKSFEASDARKKNISFLKFCQIMDQAINPDEDFFNVVPVEVHTKRKIY